MNNINIDIQNFHNELINLVNTSNLPVMVAYYIYKDVFNELTKIAEESMKTESKEEEVQIIEPFQESEEKK